MTIYLRNLNLDRTRDRTLTLQEEKAFVLEHILKDFQAVGEDQTHPTKLKKLFERFIPNEEAENVLYTIDFRNLKGAKLNPHTGFLLQYEKPLGISEVTQELEHLESYDRRSPSKIDFLPGTRKEVISSKQSIIRDEIEYVVRLWNLEEDYFSFKERKFKPFYKRLLIDLQAYFTGKIRGDYLESNSSHDRKEILDENRKVIEERVKSASEEEIQELLDPDQIGSHLGEKYTELRRYGKLIEAV